MIRQVITTESGDDPTDTLDQASRKPRVDTSLVSLHNNLGSTAENDSAWSIRISRSMFAAYAMTHGGQVPAYCFVRLDFVYSKRAKAAALANTERTIAGEKPAKRPLAPCACSTCLAQSSVPVHTTRLGRCCHYGLPFHPHRSTVSNYRRSQMLLIVRLSTPRRRAPAGARLNAGYEATLREELQLMGTSTKLP